MNEDEGEKRGNRREVNKKETNESKEKKENEAKTRKESEEKKEGK